MSAALLDGLLRTHAALCCQDESLACMLGGAGGDAPAAAAAAADPSGTPGMRSALAARYHLASCLRCYVEAAQAWQVRLARWPRHRMAGCLP